MSRLSVCIPARNEPFLHRTIEEAFGKAWGDVEVVVLLDGAAPVEPIVEREGLVVLENLNAVGLGAGTRQMAERATGEYMLKLDAHCLLADGYDQALKEVCGERDLVVPARYQLKDATWTRGYGPIHYLYVTYPWIGEPQFGAGLHGKKWQGPDGLGTDYFWPERAWKDRHPTDEIIAFQGSAYCMHRERFLALGGVDDRYMLWQESQCIGMKVWQSGGRCLRAKHTWYAHLHKGSRHGRGYWIRKRKMHEANLYSADYWMNDRWEHPLKERGTRWVVEHFWPIPGWPEDWDDPHWQKDFTYPKGAA